MKFRQVQVTVGDDYKHITGYKVTDKDDKPLGLVRRSVRWPGRWVAGKTDVTHMPRLFGPYSTRKEAAESLVSGHAS